MIDYNSVIYRTDWYSDGLLLLQEGSLYAVLWELDKNEEIEWFDIDGLINIGMIFAQGEDIRLFIRNHVGEERWALYVLENM